MKEHLIGTHYLLSRWGRWGQGPNLGLPTMSPMFGERCLKSPIWGADAPDHEVELCNKAVGRLPQAERQFINRQYCLDWKVGEFLKAYGWRFRSKYHRELEKHIGAVNKLLCG